MNALGEALGPGCNAQMNTLVDQDIVKQSYLSVKIILGNLVNG